MSLKPWHWWIIIFNAGAIVFVGLIVIILVLCRRCERYAATNKQRKIDEKFARLAKDVHGQTSPRSPPAAAQRAVRPAELSRPQARPNVLAREASQDPYGAGAESGRHDGGLTFSEGQYSAPAAPLDPQDGLSVGDRVLACWPSEGGRQDWLPATLLRVDRAAQDCAVQWEDGSRTEEMPLSYIQHYFPTSLDGPEPVPAPPIFQPQVGDGVEGLYHDGWHRATIVAVGADGSYTLRWSEDDSTTPGVPIDLLRPLAAGSPARGPESLGSPSSAGPLLRSPPAGAASRSPPRREEAPEDGAMVECLWQDEDTGEMQPLPATVQAVDGQQRTCTVRWQDGTHTEQMFFHDVRPASKPDHQTV
eukprot:TRINITY_DN51694_c0_g1_i1.p1 TRINITY_DN51694_c0_g1~~TRINITY_DN51694_c0_g1_i1.p1  ORF type:complete len:361 (+),score=58.49 TRINITY_DN51694_c0_g1_i1:88-1170(+)